MIPFPRRNPRAISLSAADFQAVEIIPPHRARALTNPCIVFERTFTAEITKLLEALPTVPGGAMPHLLPREIPIPNFLVPVVESRRTHVTPRALILPREPSRRSGAAGARRRRKSLLPWATAVMAVVVATGLVVDEVKAGRMGRAFDAAASVIDGSWR
jgi:hypothetical protein